MKVCKFRLLAFNIAPVAWYAAKNIRSCASWLNCVARTHLSITARRRSLARPSARHTCPCQGLSTTSGRPVAGSMTPTGAEQGEIRDSCCRSHLQGAGGAWREAHLALTSSLSPPCSCRLIYYKARYHCFFQHVARGKSARRDARLLYVFPAAAYPPLLHMEV